MLEEDHYYPFGLTLNTTEMQTGVNPQPYKLTTKELEKSFDLNMYDFGARQFDMQRGQWTTLDPLSEKNYSESAYCYVGNNPVRFIDPDGRNAVQIVDKENQTITIQAIYYVQTQSSFRGSPVVGFSSEDIEILNKIDDQLNKDKKNNIVTDGEYAGYKVVFDLQFKDGGTLEDAKELAKSEKVGNISVGNTFTKGDGTKIGRFLPKYDMYDQVKSRIGGITVDHKDVMMNSVTDEYNSRVHELFHTFFFDRDDASNGVGAYYKQGKVNKDDINNLINNTPLLPQIIAP